MSEEIKMNAVNFGFDPTWIADFLSKWGEQALQFVIEAARHGLSISWIVELVTKFGPSVLDFLVSLLNKKSMVAMTGNFKAATGEVITGNVIEGLDASFLETIIEKYLPDILNKFLPSLIEKYGPLIFQWITSLLLNNLKK